MSAGQMTYPLDSPSMLCCCDDWHNEATVAQLVEQLIRNLLLIGIATALSLFL